MLWCCPLPKTSYASGAALGIFVVTAPTNIPLKIHEIGFFGYGTDTVQSPIELRAGKCSAAGTSTSDNPTPWASSVSGLTVPFTFGRAHSVIMTFDTDEPGWNAAVHPQSGLVYPMFEPYRVAPSHIWGFAMGDPGTATSFSGYVLIET